MKREKGFSPPGIRWFARVLDIVLITLVSIGFFWTVRHFHLPSYWLHVFGFFPFLYDVVLHAIWGQTVGKRFMSIAVTFKKKRRIGFYRSILRSLHLLAFLLLILLANLTSGPFTLQSPQEMSSFLGYIHLFIVTWTLLEVAVMLFDTKVRSIHDLIAGTVVVNK